MPAAMARVVAGVQAEVMVLSYNNESWLSFAELYDLCSGRGHVEVLAFDSARYVGARIGIHDRTGAKVGRVSHLRNTEYMLVSGTGPGPVDGGRGGDRRLGRHRRRTGTGAGRSAVRVLTGSDAQGAMVKTSALSAGTVRSETADEVGVAEVRVTPLVAASDGAPRLNVETSWAAGPISRFSWVRSEDVVLSTTTAVSPLGRPTAYSDTPTGSCSEDVVLVLSTVPPSSELTSCMA